MGKAEHSVENYLSGEVEKFGGITRKWVSPGRSGVPDQIVIVPTHPVWFVEVKTLGEVPEDHQMREMKRLREAGALVTWVAGKAGVDKFMERFK